MSLKNITARELASIGLYRTRRGKPLKRGQCYVEALLRQIKMAGLPVPLREVKFHPKRKWRFDLCWNVKPKAPDSIAIEVEGGIWSGGRHTRGAGFIGDIEKYNEATLIGWQVYRIPTEWVRSGKALKVIEDALGVTR